nr:adenylyl-sulfate kinase [Tistlia consotensis]
MPAATAVAAAEQKSLLRFLTCGSVDDGKSTLIGRLLFDSGSVFDDQMAAVARDSRKFGTTGEEPDLALLLDGLEAEREQGITIDVAYRYFSTARRKFIVADAPGHAQYTRNMAVAASVSDLAVLVVDARKGVSEQTRRHLTVARLLGVRHAVLAVNKIDLADYSQARFREIEADLRRLAEAFETCRAIPLSARYGDNVALPSERLAWFDGPTLLELLETVEAGHDEGDRPFRLQVQLVCRPDSAFRGYQGTVASGRIAPGDPVVAALSGQTTRIARIADRDGDREGAQAGDAVTLTLADEIDISRGDVLAEAANRPEVSDQFAAHLVWMGDEPLLPGREYLVKCGTRILPASVTEISHRLDVASGERLAAKKLDLNDIGFAKLALSQPIAFEPYAVNRRMGAFLLIDRFSNATLAAGVIEHGLRRATNIHWQSVDVDKAARAAAKHQRPGVLWFTGLSGSGKSTIANLVEKKLHAEGRHTYLLDGDNVRHGLNRDLGFTDADRVENIRRVAEVARLMADAGLIVLVSFISPFRAERRMARELMGEDFLEVWVDTPLEICRQRDPKGLYKKAFAGQLSNFTGVDSPYEPPETAELHVETARQSAEAAADAIVEYLRARDAAR